VLIKIISIVKNFGEKYSCKKVGGYPPTFLQGYYFFPPNFLQFKKSPLCYNIVDRQ